MWYYATRSVKWDKYLPSLLTATFGKAFHDLCRLWIKPST